MTKIRAMHVMKSNEPKISTPEAYIIICFALIADGINWIPVVNWLTVPFTLLGFHLYLTIKGVRRGFNLAGNAAEMIPGISVLPCLTAGIVATIIADRATTKIVMQKIVRQPKKIRRLV